MRKHKRRLLLQVIMIVLPLFMIMTTAICWLVERNSVNSFLEAQNTHMTFQLEQAHEYTFFLDDNMMTWLFDRLDEDPMLFREPVTEEEEKAYLESGQESMMDIDYLKTASDDYKNYVSKGFYESIDGTIERERGNEETDILFIMDLSEGRECMVISEYNTTGQNRRIGDSYDIKISEHPALAEMVESCDDKIVFERAEGYPGDGNNYIGYKPIIADGKVRAVLGMVYNWDGFKASLESTIIKTMLLCIAGMLTVMAFIIIFLYRRAVRPVTRMTRAVSGYKDDNSTENIVKSMLDIDSNNELGYLSDAIADFAIDIERSNKENVRIAVARERAEKEAYEAKVAVMASQIRPHFMYNALTSIAMMCQIDPETAQEATITFAKYLRGNMDSLKQTKPVPFEVELDHLKKYLYIEKLRFGKKLNVEYDIQATGFKLPMLSVQPLVENAVKHGVGMKKGGGTVTVISRESENAFEVIVRDDGVGFDINAPKKDDRRSHVGMENTRSRLKEMCCGTVNIESTVGVGTTAAIILPKEGQNNEDTVS